MLVGEAVVLAGGLGKRMKPLTPHVPKPLLPLLNKPIIEHVVKMLRGAGVERVVVVLGPHTKKVVDYLGDGGGLGVEVAYAFQPKPLGNAHALVQAIPLLRSDLVAVVACDNLFKAEDVHLFLNEFVHSGADAAIAVVEACGDEISSSSLVEADSSGLVLRVVEKPSVEAEFSGLAGVSLHAFRLRALSVLEELKPSKRGEIELADAFNKMIEQGMRVVLHRVSWRIHLTTPWDLLRANLELLSEVSGAPAHWNFELLPPALVGEGSRISEGCSIGPYAVLGKNVVVGRNCVLRRCLLMDCVCLGDSVVVEEAVVGCGAQLKKSVRRAVVPPKEIVS